MKNKPVYERFYIFRSADIDEICDYLLANPFQPECHTNNNRINFEYKEFCNKVIQKFVTRKMALRYSINQSPLIN